MKKPVPIIIEALVIPSERPALIAAAEQLSECLGEAAGGPNWPVRVQFRLPNTAITLEQPPSVVITSLRAEADNVSEPIGETEARWRVYLDELKAVGAPVFVCTVFRLVQERSTNKDADAVLERIRRLNRMAVDLSHDLDVAVIDIDRAFAHIGARNLQSDYRTHSFAAAEVAGHAAAWSMLSFGLDDTIDPDLQEKAKTILGDLRAIDVLVTRRFERRERMKAQNGSPA